MYTPLINIIYYINNINNFDDLISIQRSLLLMLNSYDNNEFYRLIVYMTDEKMIYKVSDRWLPFLIEKAIFGTDVGGFQFYHYVTEYIKTRQYNSLYACAIILKNGFAGCYKIFPINIYNEIVEILHIDKNLNNTTIYNSYVPHLQYTNGISIWWIIIPIIIMWIINIIINIFTLYYSNQYIKKML